MAGRAVRQTENRFVPDRSVTWLASGRVTATAEGTDSRTKRARALTLAATSLGFAIVQLDVSVVNVAVKSIGVSLGGGVSSLQLVVSAYTVAFAAFILTAGALGDRVGARRVFLAGFLLFTAASVVCGLAPDLVALVTARAVQGVGAGILVPASLSLISHAFPEAGARERAIGLYLAGASLALAGGPLIGGMLITALGWRSIFFINVPVAMLGMALTVGWAGETSRAPGRRLDLPGQVAALVMLVSLFGAIIDGGSRGFGTPPALAGLALSLLAGAGFVAIEARSPNPMLPLRLFARRRFSLSASMGLLVNTAFYGLIFVLSLFFQRGQHLTPLQTGLGLAPTMVAVGGGNLVAHRLSARLGLRATITVGSLLAGMACVALLGVNAETPYPALVVPLAAVGLGGGIVVPTITAELLGSVERARSGVAAGTLNTLRQTGSAIGVAVFGSLISGGLIFGLHAALLISALLMLAIAGLGPFLGANR